MNAAAEILAALKPLTAREERGRQIAKMGGIREVGAQFSVPSQTPGSPPYLVDLVEQTCTCDDYELRRKPCKHYEAVLSWIAAEGEAGTAAVQVKPAKRKHYKQNWPVYNAAQTREKEMVAKLLAALCAGLQTAPQQRRRGQQPLRLEDKSSPPR